MNQKSVFLQALIVAAAIFIIGILIGVYFENLRVASMQDTFYESETKINDFELSSKIIFQSNLSCDLIQQRSISFADQIYSEALILEKYDNSNQLTQRFMPLHKRYDLLRTILWKDIIDNKKVCKNRINTVVYLYQYSNPPLEIQGVQGAMSNYLGDLKNKYGDNITLIPIAADTGLDSLDSIRQIYNLTKVPVIFVNEKYKVEDINDLKQIDKYLSIKNS
jgi:hypothetical protein